MSTFVFVSGAWLGSWCWKRMTPFLMNQSVYCPTLTGLGERSHLTDHEINLSTHIQDVVNLIIYEELNDVVLVGHSYAGFVITGVADQLPKRIKHLVYLDANVPQGNEAFFDAWSENGRNIVYTEAKAAGTPRFWPLPKDVVDLFNPSDQGLMKSKATAHPIGTFEEALISNQQNWESLPKTYILCEDGRQQFPPYVENAKSSSEWGFTSLETHHWPMISKPKELAMIFNQIENY